MLDIRYLLMKPIHTMGGHSRNTEENVSLPVLQQAAMNDVRKHRPDIHILVTHIATWNKPSLSGDQRAGYKITRMELSIVLFGYHRKFGLAKPIPTELVMNF